MEKAPPTLQRGRSKKALPLTGEGWAGAQWVFGSAGSIGGGLESAARL
jgi:hypothetical protein